MVGFYQILAGNVIACLELLLNCQCHFQVIFFLGLGLTVNEINIKKVQKQDLKNIKNVKGCRDDIIVKVNLQSPIPTSFYITVTENDAGMRLCKFTFTITSSIPCLQTFWHAIPTSFYIFLSLVH